jgi:hypothetical protein
VRHAGSSRQAQASGQGGFLRPLLYVQCCTDTGCGERYKQSVSTRGFKLKHNEASSKTTVSQC